MHAFSIVRGQTECVEVCVAGLNSDPLLTECVGTKGLRKSERKQRRRMGKRESPAVIHFVRQRKWILCRSLLATTRRLPGGPGAPPPTSGPNFAFNPVQLLKTLFLQLKVKTWPPSDGFSLRKLYIHAVLQPAFHPAALVVPSLLPSARSSFTQTQTSDH